MMGTLGACYAPSMVISTGDNFYESGLTGPNDPYFAATFKDVYTHPSLQARPLLYCHAHLSCCL